MTDSLRNEQRAVTIAEIARRCQVSNGTVSKALNGSGEISAARAEAIRATALEMGYDATAYPEARRLVARRSGRKVINHQLAACFPPYFTHAAYYTAIFSGIIDILTQTEYGLLTLIETSTLPTETVVRRFPSSLRRGEVDGIIFFGRARAAHPVLDVLTRIPACRHLVKLSLLNPEPGCATVMVDDGDGMRQAAAHLLALGHRRILYVRHELASTDATRREDGIRRALFDQGLDPDTHLQILKSKQVDLMLPNHYVISPPSIIPAESHPVIRYLREHPEITAIITHNDAAATQLKYLCEEVGWRIPEDYSLIGCDDTDPILDMRGHNVLTSVRLPLHRLGQEAARVLIRLISGEENAEVDTLHVQLPAELVVRASTARVKRRRLTGG